MTTTATTPSVFVSIGLLARNEAASIGRTLEFLFLQSLFAELETRGLHAEIHCVVNGSTDDTVAIAERVFEIESARHPHRDHFTALVHNLREPGKMNAWNEFVHRISAPEARYLILMDADIAFGHAATLRNLCTTLDSRETAEIAVGDPVKDLALKERPTWREKLSLATSRMTLNAPAQLTAQLYCIRAGTARRIRMPRDLAACEDGFIKCLVCTDFATRETQPERIVRAPNASHIFEAYVSPWDILRNQKRQMIGQTFVHVLVDCFLPTLPPTERSNLDPVVRRLDSEDPDWLQRWIANHLRSTRRFWRLFPDTLTFRFRRLADLSGTAKLRHLPAALAGFAVTLAAAWLAARALRRGQTQYWPDKGNRRPAGAKSAPLNEVRSLRPD